MTAAPPLPEGELPASSPTLNDSVAKGSHGSFPSTLLDPSMEAPPGAGDVFHGPPAKGTYMSMIRSLMKQQGASFLRKDVVTQLCDDVSEAFKNERSLLEIAIPTSDDTLVVVGDVHGQFADLSQHILTPHDPTKMAKDRVFLFLGDYVDRGPHGVEVVMLLFALKVEYPRNIFILRGNHEEAQTSRIYGFLFEVKTKFQDLTVWAKFNEVFCYLPLAALVITREKRFLGLHGGLSPDLTSVQAIEGIDRADYGGMLDNISSNIIDGILWSDPTDATNRFRGNERGCGYTFGQLATAEFCQANQLEFICRAHQMTMEGYCWTHDNKCLTVFSSPNYCGISNNLGAIMTLTGEFDLRFVQFSAAVSSAAAPAAAPQPFLSYF